MRSIVTLLEPLRQRQRKKLLWILGLVLCYTLVGFFILPPIIRVIAVKQLAKQLGREVSIQKVKLNPYVFSVTVRGLLIKDKDGEPFVSWDEVYVNLQLASFFGHPWVFREISTSRPFVRVQVNKDYSLNFSDLLAQVATNAAPRTPAKPLALRIDRLQVTGATAGLTDLSTRTPFHRTLGPLDVMMVNFRTDPDTKNPYSFNGTTDAGGKFSWTGSFCLEPLSSQGELSVENFALNKYAPLYQDFVRFEIKDGVVDARSVYRVEFNALNHRTAISNAAFTLRSFKVAEAGADSNFLEVPSLTVQGVSADTDTHRADVASIATAGARLNVRRDQQKNVNLIEVAQPAEGAADARSGILLLLRTVTNALTALQQSTNLWIGSLQEVKVEDCALHLEDLANSRPVRLDLDQIALTASHISNLPGTNLSASLSLRWNTNGTVKTDLQASLAPLKAEVQLAVDQLELRPLDPYLEPKVNVFILGSKLGVDGRIHVSTTTNGLPQAVFQGGGRLDDFSVLDGELAEDLLKWGSLRLSGMEASLNPLTVTIQEVALDDLSVRAVIETNRTINLLAALRLTDTNAPAASTSTGAGETKPARRRENIAPHAHEAQASSSAEPAALAALPKTSIANVVISNAQIFFTDRSLTPNVNLSIRQAGGTIAGLSSDQLQRAVIALHARVDNVGPVEITGTINPFSQSETNDVKIGAKNVDLTPTSPYVGKFAGYRLAEGKMALDLNYHLTGRKLKSENLITLDRFTFGDKVNSPDATKLPVKLAVAILKDRQGRIELDVPIEGSLDDPEFRMHKVIVRAMVNILTKVATSPFSLLGAIFGGKSEELAYQDFPPGSAEVQLAGKEKLDSLLKALTNRPGLQVEVEGSYDPVADLDGLRHRALEEKLRTRKWLTLRKSERETLPPSQVTFTPEERPKWLKGLYADALSKGEIKISSGQTNQTTAADGSTSGAGAQPVAWSQLFPAERDKGAALLMDKETTIRAVPANKTAGTTAEAHAAAPDPVEQALLESIAVTDADFAALAAKRAKAVRDYLVENGKAEAERVFLAEAQTGTTKAQGSRAYLQLR
jgi:hypothetical protein